MQTRHAIQIEGLTIVYTSRKQSYTAVHDLSLQVTDGETVGFLGANGAGKTTTIKMLLHFITPTRGRAWLYGVPCEQPRARQKVGYMPEQPYFPRYLTPRELLAAHAALAGVPAHETKYRVELALELARADHFAHRPIGKLSKGMTQRVALAQALVGNPQLLILDEPASGLDPVSRVEMRNVLQVLKEQGKTIFLSSHHLGEVELICDRVAIIHQGRLLAFGAPDELTQQTDRYVIIAEKVNADVERTLRSLCSNVRRDGFQVVAVTHQEQVYEVTHLLAKAQAHLISLVQQRETLEEAFLRIVQSAPVTTFADKAA
ncbi:MAG: ABC transporter ATP-binding protein [Armatimonadota bacterium]|nr:ABC transporter ATP-binding protein [bacterium]MDW8320812.1 ABC transporter ATP-binding protein [Armatimonadota bacterium]